VIVLDASVLIAHLDEGDEHHARATRMLEYESDALFGASSITVAEVLVGPARTGRLEEGRAALVTLGLHEVALGADAAWRLAELRADTGLKLPDCCVLLAAQEAQADALVSFDDRLVGAAGRLGVAVR